MFASRSIRVLVGLAALKCCVTVALAGEVNSLTFTGRVLLADGSPAGGAIVEQQGTNQHKTFSTVADAEGRFQTAAPFENGVQLHIRTGDDSQQAIYTLSAPSVRETVRTSQVIKLELATVHNVSVTAAGNPVANVKVILSGSGFSAGATTGSAGRTDVRIPAGASLRSVAGYHAGLGVGGQFFREGIAAKENYRIELQPPATHELQVIDDNDQPIADFECSVDVAVGDYEFILVSPLAETRIKTDHAGRAKLAWPPRDNLRVVSPRIWSDEWKPDSLNSDRIKEGITTQKLRRKQAVAGRLIVPEGIDPSGILISGSGFGTGETCDLPSARAAKDGTFTLMVPADHSYVIGILDTEWACEPWTGDLRTSGDTQPFQLELAMYPATPVAIRVTRGLEHQPLANTFVQFETEREFKFTGDDGIRGNALGSVHCWLLTDSAGVARIGVGRGKHKLNLNSGEWTQVQTLDVKSAAPIEVDFYRPWLGKRKITGELVSSGQPFEPSAGATIMAWTTRDPYMPLQHAPRLLKDGKFELEFDAEHASLLFFDAERKSSVSCEIGPEDTSVTLKLEPTATYGGILRNEAGKPVVDREIYLAPEGNFDRVIVSQQPDAAGRYHWDAVPSHAALTLGVRSDPSGPHSYISRAQRLFEPAEVRESDSPRVREMSDSPTVARAETALAKAVPIVCRDAKLCAMRALIVLNADDSASTRNLISRLLDTEETHDVLAYRVLSLSPQRQQEEKAVIAERNWPKPETEEVLLIALDQQETVVAHVRLKAAQLDTALAEGRQFLSVQRPVQRDATVLLAAAQVEAASSGKRLWIVSGGPRCGPCFLLARWLDDQHALLEKDYVFVKIMGGIDKNYDAVDPLLPGSKLSGVPFHAIVEPGGNVLITSKGPLGNIGMPNGIEGIGHLKKMLEQTAQRLSAVEIAVLEQSLAPK